MGLHIFKSQGVSRVSKTPKIIIIGAGLAGLTTALRLYQRHFDVDLYEAKSRVGGRIHTVYMENQEGLCSPVELGGQNITDGGHAFHIQNLAFELNLGMEEKTVPFSVLDYQKGQYRDFNSLLDSLALSKDQIQEKLKEMAQRCTSMADVLDTFFPKGHVLRQPLYVRLKAYEGIDPRDQSVYHNMDTLRCMLEGGLAVAHESIGSTLQKVTVKRILGGGAKLPLKIAEILRDRVHLNKALECVFYEADKIKLLFKDGSYAHCDKLILAVPTSPLLDIQFEPGMIPNHQLQEISKVGYGSNCKIIVPVDYQDTSHRSIMTDSQISFLNEDGNIMMYCVDNSCLSSFSKQINILTKGYGSIKIPKEVPLEAQDDQFIKYDCAVTKIWNLDPYIKGAYSGYTIGLGQTLDHHVAYKNIEVKAIFKPINDHIFFIGEHTTLLEEIGTMEAAVESGERMARVFTEI